MASSCSVQTAVMVERNGCARPVPLARGNAGRVVLDTLALHNVEVLGEWTEVKQEVRAVLRRFFKKTVERRPVILPVILEM